MRKQNNSLITDINSVKVALSKKAGEEVVKEAFEKATDLPNIRAPISSVLPGASVHWAS